MVDKEVLNLGIRKYLKKVGIASHEKMEKAVAEAVEADTVGDTTALTPSMTLRIPELGLELTVEGSIPLS